VVAACRPQRPNILLLVVDSLRSDHLGFAGYDRPTTPCLDSLAARGVAFTRCTAQAPYTLASVPSMLTGKFPTCCIRPADVALPGYAAPLPAVRLGDGATCLSTLLRPYGYVSGMINASGQIRYRALGLQEQFDFVDETVECFTGDCAARINERVLCWLSQRHGGPWFCYVHYMDVHHPYDAPTPYSSRFSPGYGVLATPRFHGQWKDTWTDPSPGELAHVIGMYDAEIAYLDSQIRELLAGLAVRRLHENLVIVVASDHGEELNEHGGFGHGHALYEEQIRCPLILVWPGRVPAGLRLDCPVMNIDIAPTVLDLLEIDEPQGLQGTSVACCFNGTGAPRVVYSERRGYSVRRGHWKLWDGDHGMTRLFDLSADPGENVNLANIAPDTLRALRGAIQEWRNTLLPPRRPAELASSPTPDPEALARLRALGYRG
jgi:arylsulfatase A-like enzyme